MKFPFYFTASIILVWAMSANTRAAPPPDGEYFDCSFDTAGEEPGKAYVTISWLRKTAAIRHVGNVFSGVPTRTAEGISIEIDQVLEITSVIRFAEEGRFFIAWSDQGGDAPRVAKFSGTRLYHHQKPTGPFFFAGTCLPTAPPTD